MPYILKFKSSIESVQQGKYNVLYNAVNYLKSKYMCFSERSFCKKIRLELWLENVDNMSHRFIESQ